MARRSQLRLHDQSGVAYAILVGSAHSAMLEAFTAEKQMGRITKAELARRLGITESRLSRIMNSRGNIELRTIGAVLGALDHFGEVTVRRRTAVPNSPTNMRGPGDVSISDGVTQTAHDLAGSARIQSRFMPV
jgi:transcriptional regulator with XRE-family HTH domain